MNKLKTTIKNSTIGAMRSRDGSVTTWRMLSSEIKNIEIEKKRELSDEEIINLVRKQVKQRQESLQMYDTASRSDLAAKEQAEIEILQTLLPKELSVDELEDLLRPLVDANPGVQGVRLMKEAMNLVSGRADGNLVRGTLTSLTDS